MTNLVKIQQRLSSAEAFDEMALEKLLRADEDSYRRGSLLRVRENIIQFIDEQDKVWRDDRRMEYLDGVMRSALLEIESYKKIREKVNEMFFFDKELKKIEAEYKRHYVEYATLHGQREIESNRHDESVLTRCREVPIDLINPQPMKPGGNNRKLGNCPFHEENTPSFWVFEGNSFHCFGCQANGQNAIDFIMKLNNSNFMDAVEYLKHY